MFYNPVYFIDFFPFSAVYNPTHHDVTVTVLIVFKKHEVAGISPQDP